MKLLRKYKLFHKDGDVKIIRSGFVLYEELKKIVRPLLLRSYNDWVDNYCCKGLRSVNMPYSPDGSYKNSGWVSWQGFLGYEKARTKERKICV